MDEPSPGALRTAAALWGGEAPLEWRGIAKDASQRSYWRLSRAGRLESRILMEGPDARENLSWLVLGRGLWFKGLPLPRIYGGDPEGGAFLMEDLGDSRLDILAGEAGFASPAARDSYRLSAEALADFHARALPALSGLSGFFQEEYSEEFMLVFEWGYFLNGLKLLKIPFELDGGLESEVLGLIRTLAALPKVFIHRDFQSRNVMMRGGRPFLIDWQGGRMGPRVYDLASLLWDPYSDLSDALREELVKVYLEKAFSLEGWSQDPSLFLDDLRRQAIVRLMQAFGAYARLSQDLGRPGYRRFLAPAASRMSELSASLSPPLRRLQSLLDSAALQGSLS